jgi:hypothetical protein
MSLVPNQSYANEATPLFVSLETLRLALAPNELQTAPILVNLPAAPTAPIAIPNIASYPTSPDTWYDVNIIGVVQLNSGVVNIGDQFQLTLELGSDAADQFKLVQMYSTVSVATPFSFRVRNKNVSSGQVALSAVTVKASTGEWELAIDSVNISAVPAA